MTTYINPFTGQTLSPSQVGYESLTISTSTSLQWPVNGNTSNVVASIIEVTATVASLNLVMPSAQQVSTGQSVLIRNIGANAFTVTDFSGNTIVSIASGIAEYIYVTNNSTDNGNWEAFTFGAGTSAANAATLAGYGIKAINTTLNQNYTEASLFSDAVLNDTNRAQFLVWSAGVGTITLPTAASVGNGWFVMVRNGGSGIVTLTPSGTDTIDTNATQQLQLTESLVIVSNGTNGYSTFAYGRSNTFAYTQLAKTVATGTYTLSAVEYANVVQEYFGALTGNVIIVLPSTVQIYYLNNQTTGSFSLTFKTSSVGAATVTVPQGQTLTVVCDGTNVYNSSSASGGSITTLTIGTGSAASPSLNFSGDTNTGIYQPATDQIGFSLNGSNAMTLSATGLAVPAGISGGTF
jgi:phage-related minor tail protein